MKTGAMHSTGHNKCKVCGKQTGDYITFNQSEMQLSVPMCDEHVKDKEMEIANIYFKGEIFLKEINKIFKNKSV
jgi:hypothetical protein